MANRNQVSDATNNDISVEMFQGAGSESGDGSAAMANELRKIYELRAQAEEQLANAQAVRRHALTEAETLLAQAQRVAGSLEAEARQTVIASVSVARREAEALIATAMSDADAIVAEAKTELARADLERSAADLALEDAKTIALQQVEEARREADALRAQALADSAETRESAKLAASSLYSSVLGQLELNAHVVSGSLDVASLAVREAFERIAAARDGFEAERDPSEEPAHEMPSDELPVLNAIAAQTQRPDPQSEHS